LKAFILPHSFVLLSYAFKVKFRPPANRRALDKSRSLSSACELISLSIQISVLAAMWIPQLGRTRLHSDAG